MNARALGTLLWTIMTAGCSSDASDEGPPAVFDASGVGRTLDNGLDVFAIRDSSVPLVAAVLTVRAGAFVENAEQAGYSHLLEHMLLKATEQHPDAEAWDRELGRLGIVTNGTTGRDRVNYFFVIPSARLDEGLGLFAQIVRGPQLTEASLETEIDVVLAEFDRNEAFPEVRQEFRVLELLFDHHPNRVNPIGVRESIERATPETLRGMFDRYYLPNNASLVLVGDVVAKTGVALVAEHFAAWQSGADPFAGRAPPKHPALRRDVNEVLTADVSESRLIVAFQGPRIDSEPRDAVAADLLSWLSRQSTHTFRSLVQPPTIIGAALEHSPARDRGVITVELRTAMGRERSAIERLPELRELFASISSDELEAAKDELWHERFASIESNLGLGLEISEDWAVGRRWAAQDYLSILYDLGVDDVRAIVERYLHDKPRVAVLLTRSELTGSDLDDRLGGLW